MVAERSADGVYGRDSSKKGSSIKLIVQPGSMRFSMRPWSSTLEVKQRLREHAGGLVQVGWMRLFHNSRELHNGQRLIDLLPSAKERGARHSSRTLTLLLKAQNPNDFNSGAYLHPWGGERYASLDEGERLLGSAATQEAERLLTSVQQSLAFGMRPDLHWDGTGGTYVLRDARRVPIAAFKPRDEEAFAPNNPRGLSGKMGQPGIHNFIVSGEAHVREVLAHRLDFHRWAGVPLTLQAEAMHPAFYVHSRRPLSRYGAKVGALQKWVEHDDCASNRGARTFPTHEVHKIAILDMRLLNTDRNDANVLVKDPPKHPHKRPGGGGSIPIPTPNHNNALGNKPMGNHPGVGSASLDFDISSMPPSMCASIDYESGDFLTEAARAAVDEEAESARGSSGSDRSDEAEHNGDARGGGGSPPSACKARTADESQKTPTLIPIDHGGCFPCQPTVIWYNWCWLEWPQLHEPLSAETLAYVAALNPTDEARLLTELGLPNSAIRATRCSTTMLQQGVAAGLSLHEIAMMMSRYDEDIPSELERLCAQAERLVRAGLHNHRLKDGEADEFADVCSRRESLGEVFPEEANGSARLSSAASPIPQRGEGASGAMPVPRRLLGSTGLKRVSSEACLSGGSSFLSMASTFENTALGGQLGKRGQADSWAENLSELSSFGANSADGVALDHSVALTASFHNYFKRLSDEAIKRALVRRRRLEEGNTSPQCKQS